VNKFFRILKTQTVKDGFVVGLGTFFTAFFGFLFTILIARSLSPEKFGVFSALASLVAILYSLGDLGVGPAIISFLPRHKDSEIKIISTSFWFQYIVGIIIALTLWSLAYFADRIIPGSLPAHFYLVGSLCFNYILIGWAQSVLTAKREFLRISMSQIIDSAFKIGFVYFLYRYSGLNISLALAANAISVCIALFLIFSKELLVVPLRFDKSIFTDLFHFSKWIAISRFFSVFYSKVDILLLNLLSGSFQAGIFAASSRVTMLFAIIVSSLGSVINPRFARFKTKTDFLAYTKKVFLLISCVAFVLLLTVLFANKIILVVFGNMFFESIIVFQLLSLSMIPFLYSAIFTAAILYTFQLPSFYAFLTFLNFFITIAINLIFIPQIGYFAPVLGTLIANLVCIVISFWKVRTLYSNSQMLK